MELNRPGTVQNKPNVTSVRKPAVKTPVSHKPKTTAAPKRAKKNINDLKKYNGKKTVHAAKAQQKQQAKEQFNARIKTQTPTNRHNVRTTKKVSGSVKNIEIKHHQSNKKQKFYVKTKNKNFKRMMIVGLIIFSLIFSILFGMVAGVVSLSLKSGKKPKTEAYYMQLGEVLEDDYSNIIEIPKESSQRYGTLYFPVSEIMDLCGLAVTGESNDLRYSVIGSESQSMRFIVDTNIAYVNKVLVRMDTPCFISNGKLHVPLDFLMQYSEGLLIDVDEDDNYITISRTVVGKDEKNKEVYADFKFKLGTNKPLTVTTREEDYNTAQTEE